MIEIILDEKPISISIRYNGYYKLVILLAIINYNTNGKKTGIEQLHILFWGLRNAKNYSVLFDLSKKRRSSLVPWTFEHGLESVIALGLVEEYISKEIVSNTLEIKITVKGQEILNSVNDLNLFHVEIEKIKEIGRIPKNKLSAANKNWHII